MSQFQVYWYDDDESIIVWEYPKHYTTEEMARVEAETHSLKAASGSERFDMILNLNRSQIPNLSGMLSSFVKGFDGLPKDVHLIVFVNPSFFAERVLDIISHLSKRAKQVLRFAETVEDAVELIESERNKPAETP